MKTRTVYICDICGEEYNTEEKAKACEQVMMQCPLYEIGDELRITRGEDEGEIVEIKGWSYTSPEIAGIRFAHKVQYLVEFSNGDSRIVFEDILDYEAI